MNSRKSFMSNTSLTAEVSCIAVEIIEKSIGSKSDGLKCLDFGSPWLAGLYSPYSPAGYTHQQRLPSQGTRKAHSTICKAFLARQECRAPTLRWCRWICCCSRLVPTGRGARTRGSAVPGDCVRWDHRVRRWKWFSVRGNRCLGGFKHGTNFSMLTGKRMCD